MTVQYSVAVRNAGLDARETEIGPSAVLKIRTGAKPASCAAADSGSVLATCALPADWMAPASGGVKSLNGSWTDTADAAGSAGHFRMYASDGTTCGIQGTVTEAGDGGDMIVDNIVFAVGQAFSVTDFSLTAGNA